MIMQITRSMHDRADHNRLSTVLVYSLPPIVKMAAIETPTNWICVTVENRGDSEQ